jgi:hypothetical protein
MGIKIKTLNNKFLIGLLALVIVLGAVWFYWQKNNEKTDTSPEAQITDKAERKPPASKDTGPGGVVDTEGDVDTQDNQDGISSESGDITVFSPRSNALINDGSTVSGLSNEGTVSYRLIDDNAGVIARGSLEVSGGKFSGKFNFSSNGTVGRFDVFHTLADGREVDVVEIPVRFK